MIGILIPEFPSQTHAFFWREAEAIRALGERVALISTRRPARSACPHAFGEVARIETHYIFPPRMASAASLARRPMRVAAGVAYLATLQQTPWRRRLALGVLLPCAEELRRHAEAEGIEHIHVHSCADAAHVAALSHILGGPSYSLTLHGDLQVYGRDHARKMASAAFVATAGAHLIDSVESEAGVPRDRVLSIWMGLDTERFTDAGRRRPVSGKLHLGTVARLNRAKGHRHALAALRQGLNRGLDLRYTIAGDGPYRGELENEVARLGLCDRVEFVGAIGEAEVLDLLQQIDAFVLPSTGLGEAAPVSVMEAMACGLPVICSIIGSTPDMITHDVDGLLIAPGDEAGLTLAFARLAEEPSLRIRIGHAARTRAVTAFASRTSAARLLEAIRGSSARPQGSAASS